MLARFRARCYHAPMTASERLGHTLVAIPVAQILGSAFFLWSYCLGFGANLVAHASATDLFSVSISDMVRVYAVSLIFPLSITLMRVTSATPYAADMVNALPIDQQASARATNRKFRIFINVISIVVFLFFGGRVIYEYISGKQFPYAQLWIAIQIPSVVVWMKFCEVRNFSNWTFESGALIGGFLISIFCTGAIKGQSDRFLSYEQARATHTYCSKSVVLRQLSTKYLAIQPDGSRALISEDCKAIFGIPAPQGTPLYQEAKPIGKLRPANVTKPKI